MANGVVVKGQKRLDRHIKKMSDPLRTFDNDVKSVAVKGHRDLARTTPKQTGNTARAWIAPHKKGLSNYIVTNTIKTPDGHSLPIILDQGRKAIKPKKANGFLYIPLTNKGRSKKLGAKIPKGLVFGIDYVLAKKARATRGTKFIEKSLKKMGNELTRRMIKTIRAVHNGQ